MSGEAVIIADQDANSRNRMILNAIARLLNNGLVVFLLAIVLSACATGPMPPESLLDLAAIKIRPAGAVNVLLNPLDRERVEPLYVWGNDRNRFKTGEIWGRYFLGTLSQADGTLTIENSKFHQEITALGFATRYIYFVEASVVVGARTYRFSAEGSNTTAGFGDRIAIFRAAIESAIESIAAQTKVALAASPARNSNSPVANPSERLRELEKLRQDAIVTEDEYRAKRKVLLEML